MKTKLLKPSGAQTFEVRASWVSKITDKNGGQNNQEGLVF